MSNTRASHALPSLLAAVALVATATHTAAAQQAAQPSTATRPAAAAAAPAKADTADKVEPANEAAKASAPAAQASAAQAKPAASPERCACESPDDPEGLTLVEPSNVIASPPEPVTAAGAPFSASAPSKTVAPELFPRAARRDQQAAGTPQQPANTNGATWTPLTNEEKMKRAARNAFFSPLGVGRTLFSSALTQYNEDDQPHKTGGDEFADFLTRFAINYSRRATRTLLGSGVYPVLFNQDPRYDRAEEGTPAVKRVGHAVSRVFVQRGDSGRLQPAVSRWAGSLSASALSNAWERSTPGHDRIGTDATFRRFGNSFVSDAINFLFIEFWPDVAKIFRR
jgi:hypothetical protein